MLSHEKLDVYQCSIEFLALTAKILDLFPRGNSALVDQLKRASMSIPLNIAEGSGKPGDTDNKRFYGIARGSAMECAAILDVCRVLKLVDDEFIQEGKVFLTRIISMLSKMCI